MSHFRRRPELQSSLNVNQKNLFPDHLEICHEIWDQLEASASKNWVSSGVRIVENAFCHDYTFVFNKDFTLQTKCRWHNFWQHEGKDSALNGSLRGTQGQPCPSLAFCKRHQIWFHYSWCLHSDGALNDEFQGFFPKEPCERVHEVQTLEGMLSSLSGIQKKGNRFILTRAKGYWIRLSGSD